MAVAPASAEAMGSSVTDGGDIRSNDGAVVFVLSRGPATGPPSRFECRFVAGANVSTFASSGMGTADGSGVAGRAHEPGLLVG